MPCSTTVQVNVEDSAINRKAREKLGLPLTGQLFPEQAAKVRKEAGILKTYNIMRTINPTAVLKRVGDKLTISVNV